MTQRAWLRDFDAHAFGTFAELGIGDRALFYPDSDPDTAPIGPMDVLVNRGAQSVSGQFARAQTAAITLQAQLADLPGEPQRGARFAILDEDDAVQEVLTVDAVADEGDALDESKITLVVRVTA